MKKRKRLGYVQCLGTSLNNRLLWISVVFLFIFFVPELLFGIVYIFTGYPPLPENLTFVFEMYVYSFLPTLLFVMLYTGLTKKNKPIFQSFMPKYGNNGLASLGLGLLVGFLMNSACVVAALLNGDISISFDFSVVQIPLYILTLFCVCIQSSTEEILTRGFLMERSRIHYPLWVAFIFNSVVFASLHLLNPGISALAVADLVVVGLAYSAGAWYTKSIWFPMGMHTAWNFTQNFIFGLPNSGLVSQFSIFKLDAVIADISWAYDPVFGVEGAVPAVFVDILLFLICIYLGIKDGRGHELISSLEKERRI